MKHSKIYGIALIIGILGAIVTMLFHPTGHDLLRQTDEIARRNEMINVAVHTLAIISIPIIFFGFMGFSRQIGWENPLVILAQTAYGVGSLGAMIAAVINGLVAPILTRQILNADEPTQKLLQLVLMNNGLLNQAFTKVYVVATAFAFILWSICFLKKGRFMQITAIIGFVIGGLSLLGTFSGNFQFNVHGFRLLILAQSIWIILIGIFMIRSKVDEENKNLPVN